MARRRSSEAAERPLIVLDFGAQYAQLIARRIRELHVYSEILPHDTPVDELRRRNPLGIVLSGGPASIHEPGAPALDPAILELGVPVLGICYGMQAMAQALGGEVGRTGIGASSARRRSATSAACSSRASATWRPAG